MTIYEIRQRDEKGVKLYGGARQFWKYKGHEVILSGPFETGKTFAVLHKLHALCWKYHNAQALMVRDTYKSLINSAVVSYEDKILPVPPTHLDSVISKYGGEKPEFYQYPNGSRITLGGLDKPDKFLSSEFDFIYINQAEEIPLDAYEKLVARATGRAGNSPYAQVMSDCNPSYPQHWILQRKQAGHLRFLEQFHRDNPILYDPQTGQQTAQGVITMQVLERLTGIRRERGLLNRWVAAEGVIYDNFSHSENVSADAEYNPEWDVYWGVDDGYTQGSGIGTAGHHPRVILFAQQTPTGGLNVFDEYYRTLEFADASIRDCLARDYRPPKLALVDSSAAEFRGHLQNASIFNAPATHTVADGIKHVRHYICDGQGVRLLKIHPRCINLIRELQSYRYTEKYSGVVAGEPKPEKLDDHAPDALRYLLYNFR